MEDLYPPFQFTQSPAALLSPPGRLGYFSKGFTPGSSLSDLIMIHHQGRRAEQIKALPGYYCLVFCNAGFCRRTAGKVSQDLRNGSVQLSMPGSMFQLERASEDLDLLVIYFRRQLIQQSPVRDHFLDRLLVQSHDLPTLCVLNSSNREEITYLLGRLKAEYENNEPFHEQIQRLIFLELLYQTSRGGKDPQTITLNTHSRPKQLAGRFLALLEQQFMNTRTVMEYADLLYVSPKHLIKVIKQETGKTPLQLIHERLLGEAQHLLCHTGLSMKEIAEYLNFDNSSHFGRFIKQGTGFNPTDYQRLQCAVA